MGDDAERSKVEEFAEPTRRTYLAAERTMLAWWRTAFAAIAVALAVGRILPDLAHLPKDEFLGLGAGWGILACAVLAYGDYRQRRGMEAIRAGKFLHLDRGVMTALTIYMLALCMATVIVAFFVS